MNNPKPLAGVLVAMLLAGCAGLPADRDGARADRSKSVGSHIARAENSDCRDPHTAQPVVRICADDLAKTGASDLGNSVRSRVPALTWPTGGGR